MKINIPGVEMGSLSAAIENLTVTMLVGMAFGEIDRQQVADVTFDVRLRGSPEQVDAQLADLAKLLRLQVEGGRRVEATIHVTLAAVEVERVGQ